MRAGQADEARQLLAAVIRQDANNETAWLWISAVMPDRENRIKCLQRVLQINPANEFAQRGLRQLGVESPAAPPPQQYEEYREEAPAQPRPAAASAPAQPLQPAPGIPSAIQPFFGIPTPAAESVARAQQALDQVMREIARRETLGQPFVSWDQPDLGRRTRQAAMRIDPIYFVIGGSVVMVGMVIAIAAIIRGQVRAIQVAQIPDTPTPTVTLTPIPTGTAMPTRTPTPTGQAAVIEPTLPPGAAPRGELRFGLTPTSPYLSTPHASNPRLEDGILAYRQGRYHDALELIELSRSAISDANPVDGYYFEALSYLGIGDYDSARRSVEAGIAVDGNFAGLYVVEGLLFEREGLTERARSSYERAMGIDPNLLDPYLLLAESYQGSGDLDSAQAQIETARESGRYTYNVDLLVAEGRIALERGNANRAVAIGNLAYYIDPTSGNVAEFLGRARLALGNVGGAVIGMEDYLLLVNPANGEVWAALGDAYAAQGRTEDSQQAYDRAIVLSPESPEPYLQRGLFHLRDGRYELALSDFQETLQHDPQNLAALEGSAQCSYALGRYDEARTALQGIEGTTGLNLDQRLLYLRALTELGEYEDVLEQIEPVFAENLSNSQRASAYELRGRARLAEGNLEAARADLEQAVALEESGTRYYYRGIIYAELGEIDRAVADLEWVVFWDRYFDYLFAEDAMMRLQPLIEAQLEANATPTPTATVTPTPTRTPTPTITPSPTRTLTPTITPSPTRTPTPSTTPSLAPSATPTS